MEKIDTQEEMSKVIKKGISVAENHGFDVKVDEFKIVQPYDDDHAIIVSVVEDEDGRTIKYDVTDSVILLEKKTGLLDVFV